MTNSATSLDRLHDLALPPEVSWWPLAPGWYVLFVVVLVLALVLSYRAWKKWRANSYRRAALRELAQAGDVAAIAAVLRRTALAFAPRHVIAEKNGTAWIAWLAEQSPTPLPESVRTQLTAGIYGRPAGSPNLASLHAFAESWINRHQPPSLKL